MLEKWTNTSSPCSREMKPKPFSALKNFTVPVAKPLSLHFVEPDLVSGSSKQTTGPGSLRHTFGSSPGRVALRAGVFGGEVAQDREALSGALADDVGDWAHLGDASR